MNKINYFFILFACFFGYVKINADQSPGFMDFYHIPNSTNIICFDYYTVHTVTQIKSGKKTKWWSNLPAPDNKIFLEDGSAWQIEHSATGVYGDYIVKVGDPVIIRPARGDSGFTLEAMSTNKNVKATLLKNESFAQSHQYEVKDILSVENGAYAILLMDFESNTESIWDMTDYQEMRNWKKGDVVIIGSDTSNLLNTPKHLLINGNLLKNDREEILKADLRS